jgi:2-polyprenyl-3-methyl-5-hydroxy-6-metoxy-1,4-benzoquinol methylase
VSGTTVAEFLGYWESEGAAYVRHGDYDWMASLVPGKRVLEIGCGLGFGTQALAARGVAVMALDTLDECLAASQKKTEGQGVSFLLADVCSLSEAAAPGHRRLCTRLHRLLADGRAGGDDWRYSA